MSVGRLSSSFNFILLAGSEFSKFTDILFENEWAILAFVAAVKKGKYAGRFEKGEIDRNFISGNCGSAINENC